MSFAIQPSLLDELLDAASEPAPPQRRELTRGAWVDIAPGWWSEADRSFAELSRRVDWRAERREMYERVVEVPRLVAHYDEHEPWPSDCLARMRDRLNEIYQPELGEPLRTAGLCLYRTGRDSVAWHGDTIGRGRVEDTIVAIVSLGSSRSLLLRPRAGGSSLKFVVGHGDLLVMGGSCQRTWEHAVPKVTRGAGPRISVQFRPRGVR